MECSERQSKENGDLLFNRVVLRTLFIDHPDIKPGRE